MIQIKSNIYSEGEYLRFMVLRDGKIIYVGNTPLPGIDIIDYSSNYIYPGFIDSHTHLLWYGLNLVRCDLSGVNSEEEIYERIEIYLGEKSNVNYVIAEGFDETTFKKNGFPSINKMDERFPDIPVIVRRICGHIAVVNTKAYKLLKKHINKNFDAKTGIVKEGIILSLNTVLKPGKAEKLSALKEAQKKLFSLGITTISDMATDDSFEIYNSKDLELNVFFYYPALFSKNLNEWRDNDNAVLKGLKLFTDGSIGGRTAAISIPYTDSGTKGEIILSEKDFQKAVHEANKKNYQLAVHAIGDRAIEFALDNLKKRRNDRIEHFELSSKKHIERVKEQKIFLSMQPNFIGNWSMPGQMYEQRLSEKYFKFNNAVNSINKQNIPMGFGSDCMPPSPIYGIESLKNAFFANQRINPTEALKFYTEGSAEIMFEKRLYGKIKKGYYADFTILDNPIEKTAVKKLHVISTFKKGKQVFTKE